MKKKKITLSILILIILIINISIALATTGTRSLTPEMQSYRYMCENGKYQIMMDSPATGYLMEEFLLQNWHFSSLEQDAVDDCIIQIDDTKVKCVNIVSGTRTLVFNVLNAPGTFSNVFANNPVIDTASGLDPVTVKGNICSPDNDNDKYPSSPITNICGCNSSEIDCNNNDPSINPGAIDIPGNGIDEDCKDGDTPLPSTISRVLPDSVQQEFEIILNVKYIGKEASFVVDERFDTAYFECGKTPTIKGECHIVNNVGKVRWVITNPSSMQLKYYLKPKVQANCYDFGDINGVYGKYLFKGRSDGKILGDYIISMNGDISCKDCVESNNGVEVCDNEFDEDCDGNICSNAGCVTESNQAGNCNDGIDNDCDNEKDWDTFGIRGPEKGDNDCSIGITSVSVSNQAPFPNQNIDVSCTTTIPGINSVQAFIDNSECSGDTPGSAWNGNTYTFKNCSVGSYAAQKTVKCTINLLRSYQSGTDKTMPITFKQCECLPSEQGNCRSGYLTNPNYIGKVCNGCYYESVNYVGDTGEESKIKGNCLDTKDNDCDRECDYDATNCPAGITHGDDGCPVNVI